MFSFRAS
jgi:hypothetical protein